METKIKYERAEMELTYFYSQDIVTASGVSSEGSGNDDSFGWDT